MSVLEFGLRLAGLPEATVKEIAAQLPALERIAAAVKEAEPLLSALLPVLVKVWPDIVAVTPLAQELIAFAKKEE